MSACQYTVVDIYTNYQSSRSSCNVAECFPNSRVGVGMNRSARGGSIKRSGQSHGLDNALYRNEYFNTQNKYLTRLGCSQLNNCWTLDKPMTHMELLASAGNFK